jgi:hypothetical protein
LKKLSAFLIIFLLVLASTTHLYYTHWCKERQTEKILPYIPRSAVLVYEIADFGKQWEHFQKIPIAKNLKQVSAFVALQKRISLLDNLVENPQSLDEISLTVSVHELGEEHLGYILYLNTREEATKRLLKHITTSIEQNKVCRETTRIYAGYKLTELSKQGTAQPLCYIKHDQYIIASYSSLLIEDVVRGLANKKQARFLSLKKTGNVQGSLYVNFRKLPQFLRAFVKRSQVETCNAALAALTATSHLNLKLTHHHLLLNGVATARKKSPSCLTNKLSDQTAGAILLAPYLPESAAVLQHFTFSDAEQLMATLQPHTSLPAINKILEEKNISLLAGTLYPLLQGEIGHCVLDTEHSDQKDQLVFIKVYHPSTFMEALKSLNLLTVLSSQKSHQPTETYQLTTNYFQYWLPGLLFPSCEAKYITQIDDYVVLANSQAGLQTWYTQYQQGKIWSNIPQKKTWLESTLDRANFSLFVDLRKVGPQIMHALLPTWQQVGRKYTHVFQNFRHVSLQLLHEHETGCYMSILLNYQEENNPKTDLVQQITATKTAISSKKLTSSRIFQAEAPIISRPWLVKSHRGQGYYTLLQDALHQLYFLDPTGNLLWKKSLDGPMTTDLFEIDYYANNKTQYLFATNKLLYLIDYYGHNISKYPHALHQTGQPTRLRVVDYNRNKHYRFLNATAQGNIYLTDKYFRPLPTWNPLPLGQDFADTPFHLRIQGKDYFLALQTNGTLQALNRKGQSYPEFPVYLKVPVHNPLLVCLGKTTDDTALIVLTDTGQHICLNLAGRVQETIQLDHSKDGARFIACPNRATGHQYVIMRQDRDKIAVMDEARNVLFELPNQAKNLLLQYYNFGCDNQFYVFTDTDEQLIYLYDHTGKLLHDSPWHSDHEASLLFLAEKKKLKIYIGMGPVLSVYEHSLASE